MTTPAESTTPLVIERTYDASIEQVWHALTDLEGMRCWFFDLAEFRAEPGFAFQFTVHHDGVDYDHRCRVTDVNPPRKLAYTWAYAGHPGTSLVTFELFPDNGGTRLKLTHDGLESLPKGPDYARERFVEGWTSLLGSSLADYLASSGAGAAGQPSTSSAGE